MGIVDTYYAFRFLYLITQKWEDTDAFKLGIIDAEGNILKKRATLVSTEEKNAYSRFHQLVWKLKKLLEKVPFGKTTIAKYATAVMLLREEFDIDRSVVENYVLENIEYTDQIVQFISENYDESYPIIFGFGFRLNENNEYELIEDIATGGFDMGPTAPKKKELDEEEEFAGDVVFTCDPGTFEKCRLGKTKYARYKTFVGEDDVGLKIREFGRKYPNKNIVLKNSLTAGMLYLRKR